MPIMLVLLFNFQANMYEHMDEIATRIEVRMDGLSDRMDGLSDRMNDLSTRLGRVEGRLGIDSAAPLPITSDSLGTAVRVSETHRP